jgi:hypothetical protein
MLLSVLSPTRGTHSHFTFSNQSMRNCVKVSNFFDSGSFCFRDTASYRYSGDDPSPSRVELNRLRYLGSKIIKMAKVSDLITQFDRHLAIGERTCPQGVKGWIGSKEWIDQHPVSSLILPLCEKHISNYSDFSFRYPGGYLRSNKSTLSGRGLTAGNRYLGIFTNQVPVIKRQEFG